MIHGGSATRGVQETVEPLMEQYKPPGLIKKMYFKNLSFGDAPFKIENVWVEDEGEKHVLMEVGTCVIGTDSLHNSDCGTVKFAWDLCCHVGRYLHCLQRLLAQI